MSFSPLISELIQSLRILPGVGQRSAERMCMHILGKDKTGALALANALTTAINTVKHCQLCRTFCETDYCSICTNPKRDHSLMCIVETPMDMLAIENSGSFNGVYFVLMGRLSPIDGIGPKELKLHALASRLKQTDPLEIILATNATVEGEATANYIIQMAESHHKPVSRIAYGVPFGGELEYVDSHTLNHAFTARKSIEPLNNKIE